MKKILLLFGMSVILTSCYTSKVAHGTVTENTPIVEVQKKKNHAILWGLLPVGKNKVQQATDIVGKKQDYLIKTQHTFVDGLLEFLTFGIYNPTTTTYYMPLKLDNE